METSTFKIGPISSKFLLLKLLKYVFKFEDCVEWLWKLSRKSRKYLNANIKYIRNIKHLEIKTFKINDLIDYIENS